MKKALLWLAATALLTVASCTKEATVTSPDGNISFGISDADGNLTYSVKVGDEKVIDASALGFVLADSTILGEDCKITSVKQTSADETWEQPWGEDHYVRNNYNGFKASVKGADGKEFGVEARVFNDGIGFRYTFPQALGNLIIMDERTEFAFTKKHTAWWMSRKTAYYEAYGEHTDFAAVDTAYTPFTITGSDGRFYAIHEAALLDFAKMNLVAEDSTTLKSYLTPMSDGTKVSVTDTRVSPWRTMIIADRAGALAESRMMLNLNEPCKIEDTSWIKPGKYIGIWWILHKYLYTWYYGPEHGATTERTMRYIDFAAANGISGVLVEGWNEGWNTDEEGNNWTHFPSRFSFTKAYPDYDFDKIMKYAASKGVQMIIHNETGADTKNYLSQIDSAYALYESYGMHYVKTGNVNPLFNQKEEHDSQFGVNYLHSIVETAAKYHICIDEHEPVIPTGVCRTWPNLMTGEAIRGQEHDAWEQDGGNRPEHQCVAPFIRGLAGPMDYTFGTFDFSNPVSPFSRVRTTIAKQLAEYVVIYSPLQMASDDPSAYEGVKAFDFIKDVPTDWEQSKVVDAVIGDYVITARQQRGGSDWFLGAITDESARDLSVKLDFLGEGEYLAQIYADGPDATMEDNPTSVAYSEKTVTAADTLDMHLTTSGGCAVRFVKK